MSQRLMQLSMLRSMWGPCTRSATCSRGGGREGEGAQHVGAVHTIRHLEVEREGGRGRPPISVGLPQLGSPAPAGHYSCICVDGLHQCVGVKCGSPSLTLVARYTHVSCRLCRSTSCTQGIYRDGEEGGGGRRPARDPVCKYYPPPHPSSPATAASAPLPAGRPLLPGWCHRAGWAGGSAHGAGTLRSVGCR